MTDVRDADLALPRTALGSTHVVRGRLDLRTPDERAALVRWVESGGALLLSPAADDAEAHALAGLVVEAALPRTEWFVTLADRPEAARLEGEVPVTSALCLLRATAEHTAVAATTSVHGRHRPTLTVRTLGDGVVVASGVADLDALRAHDVLGPFVRRLLERRAATRTRPVGVGVVGYGPFGGMGYAHGLACTETDGLVLAAAVDTVPARLEAAHADFPGIAMHGDVEALAADPDVEVAIVATPPVHHAALATRLLEAGKHVVVEKPMALTAADAEGLVALAQERRLALTVHQSRRFDPDFLALERIVRSGRLGDVFNVETFVGGFDHPCREWHSEVDASGGAVFDWGSHHIDWIVRLMGGPPERVLASHHTRVWLDTTNADQVSVWMRWDDGREATFRQSDLAAIRRPKFHVQGTAGTLEGHYRPVPFERIEPGRGHVGGESHHAEAPVDLVLVRHEPGLGLVEERVRPGPRPRWPFHANLADHLLLGEPLVVPPEQSVEVVRVLEAAHRSGTEGGTLQRLG
jgi:predicted dehydrogenase